jgi:hypothetical protein
MFMRVTPKHRSTSEKSRRLKRSLRIDWSAENEVARRMIDGIGTCPVDDVSPDHECQFGLSENAAFLLLVLEGQLRVADPASENLRAGHSKASFAAVSDWTAILSQ